MSNYNATLKQNKVKLEERNAKLEDDIRKEKEKAAAMVSSLDESDAAKLRTSQRLLTYDQKMESMNMLYRQMAAEKAALNRTKDQLEEKLDKKRVKHSYLKQELEQMTKNWENERQ